jgi:hypothetical protein
MPALSHVMEQALHRAGHDRAHPRMEADEMPVTESNLSLSRARANTRLIGAVAASMPRSAPAAQICA